MMSESDEEFSKVELEKAVKKYKKNKCQDCETEHDATTESNKINKISERQNFLAKNIDNNDSCWADLQELVNYFRTEKKIKNKKPVTYSDYVKQGAIPKFKKENNSSEKKREIHFGKNQANNKSFCTEPKVSKTESSLYSFIVNPTHDEIIMKINDEICSTPFFYIVPNNPAPNFFFSPGSYYITPKMPDSLHEQVIVFHPEGTVSAGYEKVDDLSKAQEKLSRVITKRTGSSNESLVSSMNNLGKEVSQKEDSHLNIGPVDAKLNESCSNLETSCALDKTYEKAVLNPANLKGLSAVRKTKPKTKLANKARRTDFKTDEDNLAENVDRFEMLSASLLKGDEKDLDDSDAESNKENGTERKQLEPKLSVEYLNFNKLSNIDTVDEYLDDLEEESISACENQLERMVSALSEISIEELQKKLFEFQGDENLIETYIQETKEVLKNRQLVLDLQLIFPDADPDFLYQKVEKLKDVGDSYDEINVLTEQLLDSKDYPRICENYPNDEKRSLWRKYVQNFSIKNFILNVPNPQDFAGPNGDYNKANVELIFGFLKSRYPSSSQDYLIQTFQSNKNNLTKTCEALTDLETVRLSESSFLCEDFSEAFLKEICYIDHREEIDNYLEEMVERKNLEIEEARLNNTFLSCPLCTEAELVASEVIACPEGHIFCKECIKRYIFVKLSDGIYKFLCPMEKCDAFFLNTTLEELLSQTVLLTIIKKQQAEEINKAKVDGLEFCPYCEFAYIPNPDDKIFKCQNSECLSETCRKCKEKNHIPLRCEEIERLVDVEARKKIEETMTEQLVRSCPACSKKFVKIDGCNKMKCSCGTIVCYICRKKIEGYNHFKENSNLGTCPLYSNNEILHTTNVVEAGIQARNHILQENPDIRIVHDPTIN